MEDYSRKEHPCCIAGGVFKELVEDHPWIWITIAFLFGVWFTSGKSSEELDIE